MARTIGAMQTRTDKETLQAITDVLMNAGVPKEILDRAKAELAGLERCGRCGHWLREHDRQSGPCLWIGNSRSCDCKQFTTEIKNGNSQLRTGQVKRASPVHSS